MTAQGTKAWIFCIKLLSDTQAAAVIAGLAAGIVLVSLFASLFGSVGPIVQPRFHTDLLIEGLKDRYSVDEEINFIVRAAGYGRVCAYPFIKIIDLDRGGSVIFSTAERGVFLPVCDPDPHNFEQIGHHQSLVCLTRWPSIESVITK